MSSQVSGHSTLSARRYINEIPSDHLYTETVEQVSLIEIAEPVEVKQNTALSKKAKKAGIKQGIETDFQDIILSTNNSKESDKHQILKGWKNLVTGASAESATSGFDSAPGTSRLPAAVILNATN